MLYYDIGIDKYENLAGSNLSRKVASCPGSGAMVRGDHACSFLSSDLRAVIRRAVIDNENLERRIVRRKESVQTARQKIAAVVHGNNDRYVR